MKPQPILKFWRNVEIFNLPDFNKNTNLINPGNPLPWLQPNKPLKKNYKWRYTLVFGKINKKVVVDHLNSLVKIDDTNDWEEPVNGFTCLSALILDEEGIPHQDSYVTASYTFGIRALEQKTDLSLVSYDLEQSQSNFLDRYNFKWIEIAGKEVYKGDVVLWEHLHKEIEYLKGINTWWKHTIGIYVLAEIVPKDSEMNIGFLNSFYLDDLNYLSNTEEKKLGNALRAYLKLAPPVEKRKDLIQNKEFLVDSFNPNSITSGRWPSHIEYGLYSAQMGAVNSIFSNLRNNEGLQGLNGPPGTGKTTLLKDIIAEIIVERAKIISDLGCDHLFKKGYTKIEKEGGYVSYTYNLKQSLKNNFGIVVASNNNAAVENISKELPQKKGIDKDRFPTVDYFAGCSQSLTAEENWGAIAAALGNMKNRDSFRKAFWQPDKSAEQLGFYNLLYDIYKDPTHDKTHIYQGSFIKHNKLFKSLVKELDDFKKLASSFHKLLPKYIQNKEKEIHLKNDLAKIIEYLSELSIEKTNLQKQENVTKQDADRVQDLLKLHLQQKPSFFFFQRLFSTANYQQWLFKTKSFSIKLQSLDTSLDNLRKKLDLNRNRSEELSNQKEIINKKLSELNTFFAEYKKSQEILIQKYEIDPKNIVDVDFWQKELNEIHLLNPYHSPKIATLRSKIFITALELHKDAILVNAKEIRNNLSAFFEMLSGWVTVREDMYQNLWDTFFLCVPVVSTTLASASSLFKNIDRNQIGWLLIDEAGQATPQAAVGLIHRSKRCVIVGDPLQIEPVVTIPEKLVTRLRNECKVDTEWSPCKVSVQQLADRVSLWGTYMQVGNSEEKVWTGFPLRAHRRCEDPMFTIANKIAYGNQMVNAVHEISNKEFMGPSAWFHVECSSSPYNKHVILEEIELLKTKIKELQKHYSGKIYVISPFKSVSDYCKEVFETQKTISCGTIYNRKNELYNF